MSSEEKSQEPGSKKSAVIFAVLLLVLLGAGLGGMHWLGKKKDDSSPSANRDDLDRAFRAPGEYDDNYVAGSRPNSDGPARAIFFEALPQFVIDLDRWNRDPASVASEIHSDLKASRGAVMGAAFEAQLPTQATERLEALLDACLTAAVEDLEALDEAADAIMERVLALNDALATSGLGFFVDAEVLADSRSRSILLFTFEVRRVVLYRAAGHDVRTLRIRRLDNLNWTYSLLGFTSPKRRDAVVLDNKVEEHLLELLPLLADEPLIDPFGLELDDTYAAWFTPARKRAIAVVAEELGKAGPDVAALGDLVAERHDIYRTWNELLGRRRMSIDYPNSLDVTWDYRRQMEGLATHGNMDKLDSIQKKLAGKTMREAFAMAMDHFAQSVERHETQHRLDMAGLYKLPMPDELAVYVGKLPNGYQGGGDLASAALAEMSAYLSELARDPLTPRTNLTLLARYLLAKSAWGMGESYAALAIFEGLAAELGIDHTPLVVARSIDRDVVAKLYMAFTDLDPDTLQDASMTLWARFFETDLPVLELIAR